MSKIAQLDDAPRGLTIGNYCTVGGNESDSIEIGWKFHPGKVQINLLYDTVVTWIYHADKHKTTGSKICQHTHVYWNASFNSQDLEAIQISNNRSKDKEFVKYIHNEILCHCKKRWNHTVSCNLDRFEKYHLKQNKPGEQVAGDLAVCDM